MNYTRSPFLGIIVLPLALPFTPFSTRHFHFLRLFCASRCSIHRESHRGGRDRLFLRPNFLQPYKPSFHHLPFHANKAHTSTAFTTRIAPCLHHSTPSLERRDGAPNADGGAAAAKPWRNHGSRSLEEPANGTVPPPEKWEEFSPRREKKTQRDPFLGTYGGGESFSHAWHGALL